MAYSSTSNNENFVCHDGNNIVIGSPQLISTEIIFNGRNNVFACEPGVIIENSEIKFKGDNSVIYLGSNTFHKYKNYNLSINIFNNSAFYLGRNCFINPNKGYLEVCVAEEKNIFIGNECWVSTGVILRNTDSHLIYNAHSSLRINDAKSIFIGDHVWIGLSALLLKGTQIGSGSIVGANSVVSGKRIISNTSNGGNPIKLIAKDVFWVPNATASYQSKEKKLTKNYLGKEYIFYENNNSLKFDYIDILLNNADTSIKKLNILLDITENFDKNRFAINN